EIPAATSVLAQITECVLPSSLLTVIPTDVPTPPAAIESFLETITNPCGKISVPQSLSSAFNSYSSAVVSWDKANEHLFSSYLSAISSFEASVSTNPVCASLYSQNTYVTGTTGFGVCTAVTSSQVGSATGSTSGNSSSSSSKSSASNSPATSRETTILLMGT